MIILTTITPIIQHCTGDPCKSTEIFLKKNKSFKDPKYMLHRS